VQPRTRNSRSAVSILPAALQYWKTISSQSGPLTATGRLTHALWEFLRDSTPSRRRQRFGDAEYDWEYRVNTTSGAVGWRDRLLGTFYSAYQPTEPAVFREMLDDLAARTSLSFPAFTFVDLGSGKGRTLLMASHYPFRRIVGVELLPALSDIANENIARYRSDSQQCFALESVCADATVYPMPDAPLVLFLFNPFPESPLRQALRNIADRIRRVPAPVYILYHNPEHEHVLFEFPELRKISGTHQYSTFGSVT
jgi:SAM-dependent methyltransferase